MKPKNKKIKLKRIKESINEVEYKKLINAVKGDESLRPNSKQNLLRTFTILYFTGLRLNELQEMKLSHIKELLENGETKLILPKTKSERKLFATYALYKTNR
jgi:integrase